MGRIQSYISGSWFTRTCLGILCVFFIFQIFSHIGSFSSGKGSAGSVKHISHLFLRWDPNRTGFLTGLTVGGWSGRRISPSVSGDSYSFKDSEAVDRSQFKVKPILSTGSEDLNFPLHLDFPELVRRILANETVSVSPINRPNFKILVDNAHKCQPSSLLFKSAPDLLILIKSAPSHLALRDAIRLGWGDERCWGGRQVVRLFLLGTLPPSEHEAADRLQQEMNMYRDIIQQDFVDHYYNNTYKIMFGLEWALKYCSNSPLIMFVDDDFFIYPKNVIAYIEGLSQGMRDRLISGYVWSNANPVRSNRSSGGKWYVSKREFPDSRYPPYVAAGNFFVSYQMARELNVAAQYTRYLRFDDVFLGIILKKLIRIPIHVERIHAYFMVNKTSPSFAQMISSHRFSDPALQLEAWDRLNCSQFCIEL